MSVKDIQAKYGGVSGTDVVTNGGPLTFAMSVEGLDGTGKTRFGLLTCPTPIVHVNFGDRDTKALLYDMSEARRKLVTLYNLQAQSPEGWTREEVREALKALAEIARTHLSDGGLAGGTFIIDSGSTWWDGVQEVYVAPEMEKREVDGKKKRGGIEYAQANLIVSGVLSWIKAQGAFLIITHTKAQVWDAQGPVEGKYKPKQNNRVPYIVEVRLDLSKVCATCGAPDCRAHTGRKHIAQIVKFGAGEKASSLEGLKFEDEAITFDFLYNLYARSKFPNAGALE